MGYRWDTDGIQNHLENHPRNHNWLVTITSMYIKLWKGPPFSMGKSTISMAIFKFANC